MRQSVTPDEQFKKDAALQGEELDAVQERAVLALLEKPTVEAAAASVGVSARTLYRWLSDPGFKRRFQEVRRALVERGISRLQKATDKAVDTLTRNLGCGMPGVEVRAAQVILEQSFGGVELLDLDQRLTELEAAQEAEKGAE